MITDVRYEDRFEEAGTPDKKWAVLREFMERHPDLVGHSEWFKAAVARQFIEPAVEREPDLNIELFQRRRPAAPASPTEPLEGKLSDIERQGKFCEQVIGELRRIKEFCRSRGWPIYQVIQEHPRFAAWWVRDRLGKEDRETFDSPNQWGPTVGYAHRILSTYYGVTAHTTRSWVKAYRKKFPRAKRRKRQ